jgi:type IV secretion system protein VirD4
LIAQSLNQIERAYGPNNSILDNCHVRVAFATNDERTAKRVSDSLGTATELRDSTNYAGHRLAPWLGHLMVSRQETARPLLTPGEIMQLPPADEIVMVAGTPPIRAKKARYFEDARLTERILPPPKPVEPHARAAARSSDDWSSLAIPVTAPPAAAKDGGGNDGDPANAGIRREPELPEHEEIVPAARPPEHEFDMLDDEPDVDTAKARAMRQQMRIVARQASMNPSDGIEL